MQNRRSSAVVFFFLLTIGLFPGLPGYGGIPLKFPWAGGMNSCQFCSIDLNLDGINDLLIFDRHGNRKLTFINHGSPNMADYAFSPGYAQLLPSMHDWVITYDYDLDGKKDIFTYGLGGVRVFRNISDTILKFNLVTDLLESFYYTESSGDHLPPIWSEF